MAATQVRARGARALLVAATQVRGYCDTADTAIAKRQPLLTTYSFEVSNNVLGPVPGVDVMAKRPQGLLDVGDSFRTDGGAAFLRSWHLAPCASPWQSAL
jgi:hypothetical protein